MIRNVECRVINWKAIYNENLFWVSGIYLVLYNINVFTIDD